MQINESHKQEDAVQFLTSRYTELTDGEKQIVDYLINNLDLALSMSVHTLAKKSGVSVATIVRYAQHMGFDGYKSFRIHLAKNSSGSEDFVLDLPNNPDSLEGQVTRVLRASIEAINITMEEMDHEILKRAAEMICRARQLMFFGTGTSNIVCSDAMLKYKRCGKFVSSSGEFYSAALSLANFEKDDLLVVISHSGTNADTLRILQTAKDAGHKTIAVTTFENSPIAQNADLVLYTKTRESPLHNVSITSRISQFAVMDALFMAYLSLDYENCSAHNERLSSYLTALDII